MSHKNTNFFFLWYFRKSRPIFSRSLCTRKWESLYCYALYPG